jgi:YidC/Oxa1 family membrane protein insertase
MFRHNSLNFLLFAAVAAAVVGGWWYVDRTFFPQPEPPPEKPAREALLALTGSSAFVSEPAAEWPSRFVPVAPKTEKAADVKPAEPPKPVVPSAPTEPHQLIALGGEGFNKRVLLTSKGAAIQQTALPAFDHANRLGREAKGEDGKPYPIELIPGYLRPRNPDTVTDDGVRHVLTPTAPGKSVDAATAAVLSEPSYTLLHYAMPGDPDRLPEDKEKTHDRHPSPELGHRTWKVIETVPGTDDVEAKVVFETTLGDPYHLRLRKTFTLAKRDYHVRMSLEFTGLETRSKDTKTRPPLKYQIVGPRNLPIEGEWYSNTYRNAQIGWRVPRGTLKRGSFQDAGSITTQHGGDEVRREGNTFTYAAISTQYFASALAVDPDAPEAWRNDAWDYVRPTREHLPGVPDDKPMLDDITVRAVSRPVDLGPGETAEHRYWIYNGPIKVRLLKQPHLLEKAKQGYAADPATVDRYLNDLGLHTLTDAPTPNAFGRFADAIFWTDLVIFFTNLMHTVLGWLHAVVPVWGVNILMLTVLVRLMLMVPSRRQQASMLKMQEKMTAMKPELDKLAEKYKNDPQRLNQEKTRLMLESGVNPLSSMGGCLLMFAQMPVFMGLYFCLQESIFFRLDRFLWIENLAAPDMLVWWSEKIPFISDPAGVAVTGFLPYYLGPYLNVLPVLAIALMYINMLVSTPPATDEQTAMNQKTMKFMMIFMGFFFYKMAAGMCVYFIVSTLWGLIERKLLKKKTGAAATLAPEPAPALITAPGPAKKQAAPAPAPGEGGLMARFRQRLAEKVEEIQREAETKRQIVNNPQPPKGGTSGPPSGTPGANGKGNGKKKRKKK